MGGKFYISCDERSGNTLSTVDLDYNASVIEIQEALESACTHLRYKIDVIESKGNYTYPENGRELYIRFKGFQEDLGQFTVTTSSSVPLTGNSITTEASTIVNFAPILFYENIPYEMLRTHHSKPQLSVTVGYDEFSE